MTQAKIDSKDISLGRNPLIRSKISLQKSCMGMGSVLVSKDIYNHLSSENKGKSALKN